MTDGSGPIAPNGYTIGGYLIDAYCKNHGADHRDHMDQGIGRNEREALRDLRRRGWTIRRNRTTGEETVLCRACSVESKRRVAALRKRG